MTDIDYRSLLAKYIAGVVREFPFLPHPDDFDESEFDALWEVINEVAPTLVHDIQEAAPVVTLSSFKLGHP